MSDQTEILDGLQFFGKVAASISHELKNAFSVINESAGLLSDMTASGKPLDPERTNRIAQRIQGQIRRMDGVVRNMNTFSHSVDTLTTKIDVADDVHLIVSLTQRLASNRQVSVKVESAAASVTIKVPRFSLLQLIWHCIDAAMSSVSESRAVRIHVDATSEGARIRFADIGKLALMSEILSGEPIASLLTSIGAAATLDDAAKEVCLVIGSGH